MVKVDIKTPFEPLKTISTNAIVEIEGNLYKAILTIHGDQLLLDVVGNIRVSFARFSKLYE